MSLDIYAEQDFSEKVRYSRNVEEDGAECQEMEVDIYESADRIREDQTDVKPQERGKW